MKILQRLSCLLLVLMLFISIFPAFGVSAEEFAEAPSISEEAVTPAAENIEEDPIYLISGKARAIVDVALSKIGTYVGETNYNLYWKNGSTWQKWGSYYVKNINYYQFQSGNIGYCLEPYNDSAAFGTERYPKSWADIPVKWAGSGSFEVEKQNGVALVMAYGSPNNGDTSEAGCYATSLLIWDMCCGYRNANGTLRFSNPPFYGALKSALSSSNSALWSQIDAKYNQILSDIAYHGVIPSFAARNRNQLTDANTITLNYDPVSGLYIGSATDTNGVLKNFNYLSSVDGLSFYKDGNTLNVSATPAAAAQISTAGIVVRNRGNEVEIGPEAVVLWGTNTGAQMMCTLDTPLDPVPSYFSLKANVAGNLQIIKTTNTGANLSGWSFGVYTDLGCSNPVAGSPFVSGSDGTIVAGSLLPGTYYVKELDNGDGYWGCDNAVKTVTVSAGQTASVSFSNTHYGRVTIVKTTNTGANLSGWKFGIYSDSGCTVPASEVYLTTAPDGTVTTGNLYPGTYYVKELDVSAGYWSCDGEVKQVTVTAGQTASVSFTNTHFGRLRIQKNAVNGSPEGWSFEVLDSGRNVIETIKTDTSGYATSRLLLPGNYYVREIHDRDETYWTYDTSAEKSVTVVAGARTEIGYTNTQYGRLKVIKTMVTDGPVSGWQFRIKDSNGKEIAGSPFSSSTDGTIVTGKLTPGNYSVEEIIPPDSLYYCKSQNPQIITVTAGQTASVSFTNALRPGKISVQKVDTNGNLLAGAKFLLEWSEDGNTWTPVRYSNKPDVVKGGCSNASLIDGCLTTDAEGLLTWDNLYPGIQYRLTELEAPEGYNLLTDYAFVGELPIEDLTVSLRVVNSPVYTLPHTGSFDMVWCQVGAALCSLINLTLLLISIKRKQY